jgi:hypothetical protein
MQVEYICVIKMKSTQLVLLLACMLLVGSGTKTHTEVKLICIKRQHATRTCHYNFMVDGLPYRYIDNGCKGKKDDIVKKAESGKLGLARDWKIECHVKKGADD